MDQTRSQNILILDALEEYQENHNKDLTTDEETELQELINDYINLNKNGF